MIIMLNNKSNLTKEEYLSYQKELFSIDRKNHKLVVFPSDVYLPFYKDKGIDLGSQDVSLYEEGSHTGEIAATQLKSLGVEYVLVGHSERRSEQGDNDHRINDKIKRLYQEDLKVVLCVGENLEQRENNYIEFILKQIKKDLRGIDIDKDKLIIAYEPIWAIGSGKIPSKKDIEEVVSSIKEIYPVKVLYGGSVDDSNVEKVLFPLLDGFLLGKASLYPQKVQKLIDKISN